jgi:DMSO/TMAO reductase YedYZ heme-binding membrane subunit
MTLVAAAASAKTLWYVTRGTGIVALLLLTTSIALGTLSSARWRTTRSPRFLVGALHRNLSLLAVAFVVVHVVTTVADGFAPIGLRDGVLPFLSPYRPVWLGLGTVTFDLMLALVITSVARARLGLRTWRAVHWLAYGAWPIAVVHALGTGSDARFGWLTVTAFAACSVVVVTLLLRVARSRGAAAPRLGAALAVFALPLALFIWYQAGPAQTGWARRAGTPASLLRRSAPPAAQIGARVRDTWPPRTFSEPLAGTLTQSNSPASGLIRIDIRARIRGLLLGKLRITLWGVPSGEGVALTASDVAFAAAGTTEAYVGRVVALDGTRVDARLADPAGNRIQLLAELELDQATGGVKGVLHGTTA